MAKQLVYQVAVGEVPDFYDACIESVARYCQRIGADHLVQREAVLQIAPLNSQRSDNALRLGYLPIYEKENAFRYLDTFDRVAILDADIYVRDGAPDLFDQLQTATFAAVLERDMPLLPAYAGKVVKHSRGQFDKLRDVNWQWNERGAAYFNMGMMLFSKQLADYLDGQTPAQFLRRPEFERFINGEGHWRWSTDQTLLNWWIKKTGMRTRALDWRWNALFGAVRDIGPAWFVHFFLAAKQPPGKIERTIADLCSHS